VGSLAAILVMSAISLIGLTATSASAETTLCSSPNYGYDCVAFSGYHGQSTWGYPLDSRGHNCTNYAAYRLAQNGAANPGNLGDAYNWDNSAAAKGFPVNGTPVVGSIAQWERNHVAYVEAVTASYIETTDDSWGGTTRRMRYDRGAPGWPDHFIHIRDGGTGTLYFIKTKNTGSGRVEVHSATPSSSYQSGTSTTTRFLPVDDPNGWFQMAGANLYFIKTRSTGSGRVEVHVVTAASNYQSGSSYVTAFSPGDADNGWFQMADVNFDGIQDLIFIKTRYTGSGRVEFFVADGSRNYDTVTSANVTAFSPGDASNGWFQAQSRDLVFIKTRNTGTGRVEYFRASASSGYGQVVVATGTAFSPGDQNNGWFSSEDVNADGNADLVFIKTHYPGSGRVEFFVADGSRAYQQVTSANVTRFSPADADNGWWLADSKQ
jgi:surface antigen